MAFKFISKMWEIWIVDMRIIIIIIWLKIKISKKKSSLSINNVFD